MYTCIISNSEAFNSEALAPLTLPLSPTQDAVLVPSRSSSRAGPAAALWRAERRGAAARGGVPEAAAGQVQGGPRELGAGEGAEGGLRLVGVWDFARFAPVLRLDLRLHPPCAALGLLPESAESPVSLRPSARPAPRFGAVPGRRLRRGRGSTASPHTGY